MKVGSLFSGGGLGDLGFLMAGCEIVFQVEIDDYCQKILELRFPDAKRYKDIRSVKGSELSECDILTGGFPCQDISLAGKRAGIKGARSGLWKEFFRIICEIRPKYIIVENVPGLLSNGMGVVLGDLASIGYDAEWDCLSAEIFGANHKRKRVWIVAYPSGERRYNRRHNRQKGHVLHDKNRDASQGKPERNGRECGAWEAGQVSTNPKRVRCNKGARQGVSTQQSKAVGQDIGHVCEEGNVPNAMCQGSQGQLQGFKQGYQGMPKAEVSIRCFNGPIPRTDHWAVEPRVGRLAHGVANRVERIKLLGNGQVPWVTKWIAEQIIKYEKLIRG